RGAGLGLRAGCLRGQSVPGAGLWGLRPACDAIVGLRFPTMGETSAAVIRALSLGKPLVVSDVGWFSELPDEVALKIPVGESELDALTEALALLAADGRRRAEMSRAAGELALPQHALDPAADAYAALLQRALGPAREVCPA